MTAYSNYEKTLLKTLWAWADRRHAGELDGGRRQGRPPVLASKFAPKNVLIPPKGTHAAAIRGAIVPKQRHRWFRSLKSSQALAQSVFGAVRAFGRLDLLQNVSAECGRPAFFKSNSGWKLDFEHKVCCLGEPRPTSIDVLLSGPRKHVAVECKFMERDFGRCSRTDRNRYPDPNKYCDGSYRVQDGRGQRCALTEIGIWYWDHLSHLFNWPANCDHNPCPFGSVYQLARNALAAALTPAGKLRPNAGHTLIVYDARNPAFQAGGEAMKQWDAATAACRVPGLLRRLSWQCLLSALAREPKLGYLINGVRKKYGL